MVEVDPYALGGIILSLVTGIAIAVAFLVKLSMRVKKLEDEIDKNPILNAMKQFEEGYIIRMISNFISDRLERKDG